MKDQTYFCKDWLEHPDFKYCIKQTKGRTEGQNVQCVTKGLNCQIWENRH